MAPSKKLASGRHQAQTCIKGVRKAKTFPDKPTPNVGRSN